MALLGATTLARPLCGDGSEKLTGGILASPVVPIVIGGGDEFVLEEGDDPGICKARQPVDNAIVSCAAEGMSVHFP